MTLSTLTFFLLTLVDSNSEKHIFLIEVKNWEDYYIDEATFNREILSRFTRVDERQQYNWVLVYNARHWRYIGHRNDNCYIFAYNLPQQITYNDVFDKDKIKYISRDFIDSFCLLIKNLAPETTYPDLEVENRGNRTIRDMIEQDIRMGICNDVIVSRYNTTRSYVSRCVSELRRRVPDIPDRRSKDWRRVWEIQS